MRHLPNGDDLVAGLGRGVCAPQHARQRPSGWCRLRRSLPHRRLARTRALALFGRLLGASRYFPGAVCLGCRFVPRAFRSCTHRWFTRA